MSAEAFGYRSPADLKRYETAVTHFNHFDTDGSGAIDRKEFVALHQVRCISVQPRCW